MPQLRLVVPETLDHLAADDPRAQRSRRDLLRVNRVMGSGGILVRGIRRAAPRAPARPLRVLELGAGDGRLMLHMAASLRRLWPHVQLQLLDRLALIDAGTRAAFARLGWTAEPLVTDVLDWAAGEPRHWDLIVTNLFLHHFKPPELRALLSAVAARCDLFVACEPRRAAVPLLGSRLIGLIGGNEVTRNDALLSVRAGFRDAELTALWPPGGWALQERSAGLFSHFFSAARCAITADR